MNGIVNGSGKKHAVVSNGTTNDIIAAIYEADQISAPYTKDFAVSQAGVSIKDTCANLWGFVKNNIPYNEDPDGWQFIKSPGALWKERWNHLGGTGKGGDCKSMSLFTASCLQNLDIPYIYRFISETPGSDVHHVYIVAFDENGKEIYIDCVHDMFNEQIDFAEYLDVDTAQPLNVDAKESLNLNLPTIGKIGATQAQRIQSIVNEYKNNWQAIHDGARKRIEDAINEKYSKKVMDKDVRKECFEWLDRFTDSADPMFLYRWWDTKIAPFPSGIAEKLNGAVTSTRECVDLLGCTDKDIYELAAVSCYKRYGLPVSLMLEKCYAIQLYGCEFYPVTGIPYFDFNKQVWLENGSTPVDFFLIAGCYPYVNPQGEDVLFSSGLRTGQKIYFKPLPPAGVPYWNNFGFLMTNGAEQKDIDAFVQSVPKPNVIGDVRTYNVMQTNGVLTTITATMTTEATPQEQAESIQRFNQYLQGQIDLPKVSFTEPMPNIGEPLAIGAIVAIITAVVALLSTIASIAFKAIAIKNAANRAGQFPNVPANDFAFIGVTQEGGKLYWQDVNGDGIKQPNEIKVQMPDGTVKQFNPATDAAVNNNNNFCNQPDGTMAPCGGAGRQNMLYLGLGGALLVGAVALSSRN